VSTEPPDSDDFVWDLENAPDLDVEIELELARLAAECGVDQPSRVRLTPELEEIEGKIADVEVRRNIHGDGIEPFMFGRFEAITTLRGGMGLVIKARDPQLEREVAIKLWMRSGPEAQEALVAEAKTLAKLQHPNVVTVYEPGFLNGRVYFVMEWIDGVDGHDWMAEPRSWREVRDVYVAAGTGLAAAHDAGIQHRDFKPSNILIGNDGRVVVCDFGVADSRHTTADLDEPDMIVGTPRFMAPERLRGKRGDARSDQFSFCVAMWRALYQQRPFAGDTGEELLGSIERGEIQETAGSDVPRWLSDAVRKGLSDDPDRRYRDMHELLNALRGDPLGGATGPGEPTADDVRGVGPVGRVLHKPAAGSRRAFLVAMTLTCVAALGGVQYGRAISPSEPTVEHPDLEPAPAPTLPCALSDSADTEADVDPVVLEVCRSIRIDHFDAADMLWERERVGRMNEARNGGRPITTLGADTLIIARTFIDRAEELEQVEPSKARVAASRARVWARLAATELGDLQDPSAQDVTDRAQRVAANTER
jgi:tRNA A-37 threonylcarbamoyl transferase component Bud32